MRSPFFPPLVVSFNGDDQAPYCPMVHSIDDEPDYERNDVLNDALAAARAGFADGYECLFSSLARPVAGYIRARGGADPDGLTNEVFLRAFRTLPTFRGDADQFRAWLFTIARNAVIDELRASARRAREVLEAEPPEQHGGDVEDDVLARLADERVAALLDLLSPDQRDVVALRIVGDLTVEQTAHVLDKSYEGVKALQRRALARLRKAISASRGVPR
jgi:RNA polymerase sigma-70 factor (ECF subfamily)